MNNDFNNRIEIKASQLWGRDLHKKFGAAPIHCNQLIEIFPSLWSASMKGHLLEIGCGSGADLEFLIKNSPVSQITAIDLGENISLLKKKFKTYPNITIKQGNALQLAFDNNVFDSIYSFGIFHHTVNPIKCINESARVLKKDGVIFFYLYSAHEDIFFKRLGIYLEKFIMGSFKFLPYKIQEFFCFLLSPVCWLIFTVPSRLLSVIGLKKHAKTFPFYFGSHPFTLVGDLKDRLMSPVNHRFTKLEMESILESANFSSFEVIKNSAGLYVYAKK